MTTDGGPPARPEGSGTGAGGVGGAGERAAVYDAAEDSMLLAGAAVECACPSDTVIDVGTGSGVVAARVAAASGARVLGTDVNPHACRVARTRSRPGVPAGEGGPLPVVRGDLVAPIRDNVADLVVFNPPYLPDLTGDEPTASETDEVPPDATKGGDHGAAERAPKPTDEWLRAAYAGGASGRAVIAPFLDDVDRVLAPGGRVLLLVSTLTGIEAVRDLAREAGFAPERIADESIPFETLVVLELERT